MGQLLTALGLGSSAGAGTAASGLGSTARLGSLGTGTTAGAGTAAASSMGTPQLLSAAAPAFQMSKSGKVASGSLAAPAGPSTYPIPGASIPGSTASMGIPSVGGTGSGTGAGIGPWQPSTPSPSLNEITNMGDIMSPYQQGGLGGTPLSQGALGGRPTSPFGSLVNHLSQQGQQQKDFGSSRFMDLLQQFSPHTAAILSFLKNRRGGGIPTVPGQTGPAQMVFPTQG